MGIAGVALIGTALLAGLRPAPEEPDPGPPPARVVLPGRPGEPATVTDSDHVRAPDGSTYNGIDVAYAQMMIAHHEQAVAMAGLAADRAGRAGVRALADRISAAQKPEIDVLRAWLRDREQPESEPGHDHAGMPGMQSATAMSELAAARGADFDRRFVTMMIAHHRGAQQMAGDLLRAGEDQRLSEMANETAVEQGSEINRLNDLDVA
ncbi:lipoprotein [Actinoplanes ianthinogenes]|uniref:Lipoprotein n=2 Tax=Actinoplanes ianthinogenes TaxID=122358 RepID=A0ABN6CJE1_9ACTN|nr:lipoprotein [Actinoplanes ianthinogenes]